MSLNIRAAQAADIPTLAGFQVLMAQETEDKVLDGSLVARAMQRVLQDPSLGRYYVAERGGKVVGSLMLTFEFSDWRDGLWWWIQSVYVPEEARRMGVYRALYAAVQAEAEKEPGVLGIRLYVECENERAQKTYEDLGMKRCHYHMYES